MNLLPLLLLLCQAAPADAPALAFEVASVKPSDMNVQLPSLTRVLPGGRLVATHLPLLGLIAQAHMIRFFRVEAPGWAIDTYYDVEAMPPEDDSLTPLAQGQPWHEKSLLRLQTLLADRFKLRTHTELREEDTYELVVAKEGIKMQKAAPGVEDDWRTQPTRIIASAKPASWIALALGDYLQADIVDKTGLTGLYTFEINFWNPQMGMAAESETLPSLAKATESLGLRLQSHKGPVKHLVVDHVQKPTAN